MATGARPLFARRNHAGAAGVMRGLVTRANRGIFPRAANACAAVGHQASQGKKAVHVRLARIPLLRGKTIARVLTPPVNKCCRCPR